MGCVLRVGEPVRRAAESRPGHLRRDAVRPARAFGHRRATPGADAIGGSRSRDRVALGVSRTLRARWPTGPCAESFRIGRVRLPTTSRRTALRIARTRGAALQRVVVDEHANHGRVEPRGQHALRRVGAIGSAGARGEARARRADARSPRNHGAIVVGGAALRADPRLGADHGRGVRAGAGVAVRVVEAEGVERRRGCRWPVAETIGTAVVLGRAHAVVAREMPVGDVRCTSDEEREREQEESHQKRPWTARVPRPTRSATARSSRGRIVARTSPPAIDAAEAPSTPDPIRTLRGPDS